MSEITRFEVIDGRPENFLDHRRGRVFTIDRRSEPPFEVALSWQDGGRTLKVFLSGPQLKEQE